MMSTTQEITSELRQWVIEQAKAGGGADAMLQSMRAAGWDEHTAVVAQVQALSQYLAQGLRAAANAPPVKLPDVDLSGSPSRVWAEGHAVEVLFAIQNPRVVLLGNLLSDAECDELIAAAAPHTQRSATVVDATGEIEVSEARTSSGMCFRRHGETPACERVERRIAALLDWPMVNGELLQVTHYAPGAQYKPHHDYFNPGLPGIARHLAHGGQRVATLLMYLNTPEKGGETTFPELGLSVVPKKGNALFFSYGRPHPDTKTLHAGASVIEGEKWIATKWLRQGPAV